MPQFNVVSNHNSLTHTKMRWLASNGISLVEWKNVRPLVSWLVGWTVQFLLCCAVNGFEHWNKINVTCSSQHIKWEKENISIKCVIKIAPNETLPMTFCEHQQMNSCCAGGVSFFCCCHVWFVCVSSFFHRCLSVHLEFRLIQFRFATFGSIPYHFALYLSPAQIIWNEAIYSPRGKIRFFFCISFFISWWLLLKISYIDIWINLHIKICENWSIFFALRDEK